MARVNENYLKLQGSYLFSEIGRRVRAFQEANPRAEVIRLGIGDVTLPLAPAVVGALHAAVDEMGAAETFRGYAPDLGYEFLRKAIAEHDYKARGCDISPDEIFVSDGAKCDCGNIQEIFAPDSRIAVCDPVYPVYVDSNVMAGRTGAFDPAAGGYGNVLYMPCTKENGFAPELPPEASSGISFAAPSGTPAGETPGKKEGASAGMPAGASSGTPAGETPGKMEGASAGMPADAPSGTPAGETPGKKEGASAGVSAGASFGTSAGAPSGTPAGETPGKKEGASAGALAGASSGTPAGETPGKKEGASAGVSAGASSGASARGSIGVPDLIYLCFPNNPTGAAISKDRLQQWVDYANRNGAVILYDAAYEAYISEPGIPHSIYECEGARGCAIEFRSFSKTAGFTGLRLGFTVIPKELEAGGEKLWPLWARRHGTKYNGAPYIVQRAGEAVYSAEGREQIRAQIAYYMENAKYICEGLRDAGYEAFGGVNAPYIWLRTPGKMTSWEFFDHLLHRANVVGTPGSGFGPHGEHYFRLTAFGSRENTIRAMERIRKLG